MPWLLFGFAAIAGYLYATYDRYPAINKTGNAQDLLNFPPFQLQQGKVNYIYYLTPAGQTADQLRNTLLQAGDFTPQTLHHVSRRRTQIMIPGPTPAYADLWAVDGLWTGQGGTTTANQALDIVNRLTGGQANPNSGALNPAQQLNFLLYTAAVTGNTRVVIPIAARTA